MRRSAARTARKARGGRARGVATWRGGTQRPRTDLPAVTPEVPAARPAGRAAQAAPVHRFPGEEGAAAGRSEAERLRAGARGRVALGLGPSFQPLSAKAVRREARRVALGEAGGARCLLRQSEGSAGSATAQLADPAGAEPPQGGLTGSGSSLLLFGLFFLERISGNPAEIGSIAHLPNPTLSSSHLSIHLSN